MLKMIAFAVTTALLATPAYAAVKRQKISNDISKCYAGKGPSVLITVDGFKSSSGRVRVQSYRSLANEWLKKGQWLHRIEANAKAGTMTFCVPIEKPGMHGIVVRHDVNGNRKTDIFKDGGGMSNNPSINIFNLGKPSYKKTAFRVGSGVTSIRIRMKYASK